jgi:hypothetical protein
MSTGNPFPGALVVERAVLDVGGRVAEEVPGAVQEGVAHVGFAPGRGAARWAVDAVPFPSTRASGLIPLESGL